MAELTSTICKAGHFIRVNSLSTGKFKVPVTTLDALAEEVPLKPPFLLKIDVQGAEVAVLKGAKQVLANTHMVICEADLDDFDSIHSTLIDNDFLLYDATELHRDPEGGLGWFYPIYIHRGLNHLRPRAFWTENNTEAVIGAQVMRRNAVRQRNAVLLAEIRNGSGPLSRNALCPCGSGKKYKHCCGAEIAT